MHFTDFKLQPLSLQAHLICRHGVYLSERTAGDYFVALYALYNYYVEVFYRLECSEVIMITSFHQTSLLEPYLSKINLTPLLQPAFIQ